MIYEVSTCIWLGLNNFNFVCSQCQCQLNPSKCDGPKWQVYIMIMVDLWTSVPSFHCDIIIAKMLQLTHMVKHFPNTY